MRADRILMTVTMVLLSTLVALPAWAGRGDDSKRKSKNGRTDGEIGGIGIVLEYGRPNVKGRDIWGALVPYDKVWRTGADEATTISFSGNIRIQGENLAAGTYSLFTIPGPEEWTVIFNSVAEQWGSFKYDDAKDALRVTAQPGSGEHVESLEFTIEGSTVVLRWEELALPFSVEAAD